MDTLCIVMPAYNEAACIESVVLSWLQVFEKVKGTFVVINDGSKDTTLSILERLAKKHRSLKVINQKNAGHGAAVLRGYREALGLKTDYIFQTDSDDQFLVADFWSLWDLRDKSPFITGIRAHRSDPLNRIVISKIGVATNFFFFGVRHPDPNIPFRLFESGLLRALLAEIPETVFAPNIMCTIGAELRQVIIAQVPIGHRERTTGAGSLLRLTLVKACFRTFGELWAYRARLRTISLPKYFQEKNENKISNHRSRTKRSGGRTSS